MGVSAYSSHQKDRITTAEPQCPFPGSLTCVSVSLVARIHTLESIGGSGVSRSVHHISELH